MKKLPWCRPIESGRITELNKNFRVHASFHLVLSVGARPVGLLP